MANEKKEKPGFEESMLRLEEIVRLLEREMRLWRTPYGSLKRVRSWPKAATIC